MAEKARYWVGVLYPEAMIDDWQDELSNKVQVPFEYCIHDKCLNKDGTPRKEHVHLMLVFPNTTTYKHAYSVFEGLSADGKSALNKIERVINVRHMHDYLIHDTEDSRKKKKHLYDVSERVAGNNFDIGSYEQLSMSDKNRMVKELCDLIYENQITNFADFYAYLISNFDDEYFELLRSYSGLFERLIKGCYQRTETERSQGQAKPVHLDP